MQSNRGIDGEDVESLDSSLPPTLRTLDEDIELPQRTPLYQFKCLDSYPKSTRVITPPTIAGARWVRPSHLHRKPMRTPTRISSLKIRKGMETKKRGYRECKEEIVL
jgi:hypothetical protein